MTNNGQNQGFIEIGTEDVLNWAYCPMRYWWEHNSAARDIADFENRKSGEFLVRDAVRLSLDRYFRGKKKKDPKFEKLTPLQVYDLWWGTQLKKWGIFYVIDALNKYDGTREDIEKMFGPHGTIRRNDGSQYKRPVHTKEWRSRAMSEGLLDLQRAIDANQVKAGLVSIDLPDDEFYHGPMGLAEAFAVGRSIIRKLTPQLPDPDYVVAVAEPVYLELYSVRLRTIADLVVDLGEAPRRPGRPKTNGEPEAPRRYYRYEMHLFDEDMPSPYDLARNFKLMALRQSYSANGSRDTIALDKVFVRHLRSGQNQEFDARDGENIDILEGAARSVITGSRAGLIVPRMLHGWRACGDCDYRALCFADNGVLEAFNPPLTAQIQASQEMVTQLNEMLRSSGAKDPTLPLELLEHFTEWYNNTPGVTPESISWLLSTIRAEMGS